MGIFDKQAPKDNSADLKKGIEDLALTVKEMQSNMTEIISSVKLINTNHNQLAESVGSMRSVDSQAGQEEKIETIRPLSEYTEEELGMLSERERYQVQEQVASQNMLNAVREALGPIGEQLKTVQAGAANTKAESDLRRVMTEVGSDGKMVRPDINDILPTMVELRKDASRSNLGFSDLYTVAKSHIKVQDPAKAAEIEAKHFPKSNVSQTYGGFLSTAGQKTNEPGDMSIDDAAESAAREVLEDIGGLPGAEAAGEIS